MKNKKMLMSLIAVILLASSGYIVWDLYIIRPLAGEYVSVDATDSLYELTLSKAGRINVVDVGAGNPVIEGFVFAVPDSVNRLRIKTYGETDGAFLGIKDHKLSIYPASLLKACSLTKRDTNEGQHYIIDHTCRHTCFYYSGD